MGSLKFAGDSELNFGGNFGGGGQNWGVSQHKICGRFRTKFWGDFWGRKFGEFHSIEFVGHSEPNFFWEKIGEFHSIKFVGDSESNLGSLLGEKK